jgi:hypothetical protein
MIMPDCGHTYCEYCIAEILTAARKECPAPDCRKPVLTKELDKFHRNAQLLQLLDLKPQQSNFLNRPQTTNSQEEPQHHF